MFFAQRHIFNINIRQKTDGLKRHKQNLIKSNINKIKYLRQPTVRKFKDKTNIEY